MSLIPLRRHAVACTLHLIPPLLLYQYFLSPNMLVLLVRFGLQSQIATPRYVHPTARLGLWAGFVALINGVAVFLHCVQMARPGDKSILLDFVGLRQDPSPSLVLAIDALLALLQLLVVYIAYLCDPLPTAPDAPTVLLPSASLSGRASDPLLPAHDVQDDDISEPWAIARRRRGRRRRVGGRGYDALQREEEGGGPVVNLDDSDAETDGREDERSSFLDSPSATAKPTSLSSPPSSASAIPLIFDITLRDMLGYMLGLPAPAPARRPFSGATPLGTPSGLASRSLGSLADLNATVALGRERERAREENRGSLVHEP